MTYHDPAAIASRVVVLSTRRRPAGRLHFPVSCDGERSETMGDFSGWWTGGLGRHSDCVKFIEQKNNLAESVVWMGICGVCVLAFSLPNQLKLGLRSAKARHIETLAYEKQNPATAGGEWWRRYADAGVASMYLYLGFTLLQREAERHTVVLLAQFPFLVVCSFLAVLSSQRASSHQLRAFSITSSIVMLPSVPAAVLSLLLSDDVDGKHTSAVSLLFLLLAPVYVLTANHFAAVRVFQNISHLLLLGSWYTIQLKWTLVLGLAIYSHGNAELMLCPSEALRALVAVASQNLSKSSLPFYRSLLTVVAYFAGSVYSLGALFVANAFMIRSGPRRFPMPPISKHT